MATSGTASTVIIDGISMQIDWKLYYQTATENTSKINIAAYIVADNTASLSDVDRKYAYISLGKTQIASFMGADINVESGKKKQIISTNRPVTHESDGSYSEQLVFYINCGTINGVNVGIKTATAAVDLPKIARPSVLSIPALTLGSAATLAVTRYDESQTHTIEYTCGSASGTICDKSNSESITFTPPLTLASQNTTGETVPMEIVITTFDGNGEAVNAYTYAVDAVIPQSVAPSCSLDIGDAAGYAATYGGYVQGESKFRILTKPTLAYGANIASYRITADNKIFTAADVTTDAIQGAGELTITATVTDTRGRSCTVAKTVTVLGYTRPTISSLKVRRCDADGTENESGEYVQATFSAAITSLGAKNSAAYTLGYRKTTAEKYTEISLSNYGGTYTLNEIARIFSADTGASYNVCITATDDFHSSTRETVVSTAFTTFHVPASGRGFSFGKVSEVDGLFDVAYLARFLGGYMHPVIEDGTDFDNVTTSNTYACNDAAAAGYANSPFENGTFSIEVMAAGESGDVIQRATLCAVNTVNIRVRCLVGTVWGDWITI